MKQGLLKGAITYMIDFCEQCVLGKKNRLKLGMVDHQMKGNLDYIHTDVWVPPRRHHLAKGITFLISQ